MVKERNTFREEERKFVLLAHFGRLAPTYDSKPIMNFRTFANHLRIDVGRLQKIANEA